MAAKKRQTRARVGAAKKRVTKPKAKPIPVTPEPKPEPTPPEPAGPVYQSEGHRRICELPDNATEVGERCNVSSAMIRQVRRGSKPPGDSLKRSLQQAYGIPVGSWSRKPGEAPNPGPLAAPTGPVTSLQDIELGLDVCRGVLRDPGSTTRDKLDASQRLERLTQAHQKMVGDDRSTLQKLLRSPEWSRFKRQLGEALMKHPEAARDVSETLKRLDFEGS